MSKDFTILKPISQMKLKEEITEVYCYINHNKETIEPMYNDELKLPFNVIKLVQKQMKQKTSPKKIFDMIKDVRLIYDKEKHPNDVIIDIELR